jgi:flagellar protein FliS
MTIALARSRYRQAEAVGQPRIEDPHTVIAVTLAELTRALDVLAAATAAGRPLPSEPSTRALTAIYILQSSLDFEKGGDIAMSLFELYEYARMQVLKAGRGEAQELDGARAAIADILSAWRQIGPGGAA